MSRRKGIFYPLKADNYSTIKLKERFMEKNDSILCDVKKCKHNAKGCNCCLKSVKISCGKGGSSTCCEDFSEK